MVSDQREADRFQVWQQSTREKRLRRQPTVSNCHTCPAVAAFLGCCPECGRHLPLCVAGAGRCTPSSSLTPAPPTGKLENTTTVCQPHNLFPTLHTALGLPGWWVEGSRTSQKLVQSVTSRRESPADARMPILTGSEAVHCVCAVLFKAIQFCCKGIQDGHNSQSVASQLAASEMQAKCRHRICQV